MTGPESASSPCQAPPGYWDEEEVRSEEGHSKQAGKPQNEESPDGSDDPSVACR